MMAYRYANIKKDLHGIAFKGRLAYAMRAWVCWHALRIWPACLKQAGDRRLVNAVLL